MAGRNRPARREAHGFSARSEPIRGASARKVTLQLGNEDLSFAEVASGWREDPAFRAYFITLLADAPYAAYFWETPPVTTGTLDRPFEYVLVDSPALAGMAPDPRPFASHLDRARDDDVLAFPNLGADALLVVPCPRAPHEAYPHLAAFVRNAPGSQQHALWRAVGQAMARRVGGEPTWLSTAGLGVAWLHVRLDERPKYYSHAPYRPLP